MREFDKNGLERFFRSKFRNAKNDLNSWNDPGDVIFENAFEILDGEKKERTKRRLIFIFFFGFIGIIGSGFFIQHMKINSVEKTLQELERRVAYQEPTVNLEANDSKGKGAKSSKEFSNPIAKVSKSSLNSIIGASTNIGLTNEKGTKQDSVFKKNISILSDELKYSKNYTSEKSNDFEFLKEENSYNNPVVTKTFNSVNSTNTALLKSSGNRERFNFMNLANESPLLDVESSILNINPTFEDQIISEKHSKQGFLFSVSSGINYASIKMKVKGIYQGPALSKYGNYKLGQQLNLGVAYSITDRFSVGIQTTYSSFQNQSEFFEKNDFDDQNLSMNNGELEYNMPIEILTPVGEFRTNSVFSLETSANTFEVMSMESKTSQKINTLGVSVVTSYALISQEKLQFGISGKFGYNRIIGHLSTFDMTISEDSDMFSKSISIESDKLNRALRSNAILGAGVFINYPLSENILFNFNSNYNRSLTSCTDHQNKNQPETLLNFYDSNVGISYKF
jgi:hypothetical protein